MRKLDADFNGSRLVPLYPPQGLGNKRQMAWRALSFAVFVTLVWLRMPMIMRHGRFWAEEGSTYFYNACTMPWWKALIQPQAGYLNLPANIAAIIAHHTVALPNAPHVTTAIALLIQTIPVLVLVTSADRWLQRPAALLAAVLLVATPPCGDEVWLNTINSQFHIALAAALCLALQVPVGLSGIARKILLLCAPLCCPAATALAPIFVLRAALERDRARALQALCLLIGTGLLLALFYGSNPARGHFWSPSLLVAAIASRHLALPMLGHELSSVVAGDLQEAIRAGHRPVIAFLVVAAAAAALAAALALRRNTTAIWMLASGLMIAAISYYGALHGAVDLISVDTGARYAFAPSILLALTILVVAVTGADRVAAIAWLFAAWFIAVGLVQASLPHRPGMANGPAWKPQLARWHSDPSTALLIWPTGWKMWLPANCR
ncbi:MAG TPA: hypothetical protein VMB71_08455 [Acetobacteraceae bacterium]|nr:hypothetical protein [Acetobacteraceae bacterium]